MTELAELERLLPGQLRELADPVSLGGVTRSAIERRAQRLLRRRRARRIAGGGVVAMVVIAGAGGLALREGESGARVVTRVKGGTLAPATQPVAPGTPAIAESATTTGWSTETAGAPKADQPMSTTTPAVPVATDQKPVGAQAPDPVKNAPAVPEPSTGSPAGTTRGSTGIPGPSGLEEVVPPSGRFDPQPGDSRPTVTTQQP